MYHSNIAKSWTRLCSNMWHNQKPMIVLFYIQVMLFTLYFFSRAFLAICCFWWRFAWVGLSAGSTVDPSWPSVDKKSNSRVGRPSIFSSLCFIEIWSWIAKPKLWEVVFKILSMIPSGGSSAPELSHYESPQNSARSRHITLQRGKLTMGSFIAKFETKYNVCFIFINCIQHQLSCSLRQIRRNSLRFEIRFVGNTFYPFLR